MPTPDAPVSLMNPARDFSGVGTVGFLGLTAGVQMSDRGLQSVLSPAIQQTFQVGDAMIGALHGVAGILVASALAMPLARLADKHSRKVLLLSLIGLWTVLTAVGALSPNFPVFFLGRAASGITEFAMIPIVYSLIPDLVSESRRVEANLAFAALMATGASAGFYFGGNLLEFAATLAPAGFAPWRAALLCLSLLGLPLLALGLWVRDPPRGHVSTAGGPVALLWPFVRENRVALLLFLGTGALIAVPCLLLMGTALTGDAALRAIAAFLLVTCIANALIPTMLQDLVPAALRARGFAIYSFVIAALCALGPLLTGAASVRLLGGDLLRAAMTVGVPVVLMAALCAGVSVFRRSTRPAAIADPSSFRPLHQ